MLHCVFDTFITNPDNFPRIRSDFSMVTHGGMAPMTPPELWGIWQGSVLVFPTPTTPPELLGPGTPPGPPPPTPPEAFEPGAMRHAITRLRSRNSECVKHRFWGG